jgi:hypothetical protein
MKFEKTTEKPNHITYKDLNPGDMFICARDDSNKVLIALEVNESTIKVCYLQSNSVWVWKYACVSSFPIKVQLNNNQTIKIDVID